MILRRNAKRTFALILLFATAQPASAFDLGDPWFDGPDSSMFRFDMIYESFDREVSVETDVVRIFNPSLGLGSAPGFKRDSSSEADSALFRGVFQPTVNVALQFDLGFDSGEDRDTAFVLGSSARMLLVEQDVFQISTQFGAHFIPEYGGSFSAVSLTDGPYTVTNEFDGYEVGAALIASYRKEFENGGRLVLYSGPRLSAFRGQSSTSALYTDSGGRVWYDLETKEKSLFGYVVGVRYGLWENFTARVEARLIEEQSVSAGLQFAY